MKKKTYVTPSVVVISMTSGEHLLAGSMNFKDDDIGVNAGDNADPGISSRIQIWDD